MRFLAAGETVTLVLPGDEYVKEEFRRECKCKILTAREYSKLCSERVALSADPPDWQGRAEAIIKEVLAVYPDNLILTPGCVQELLLRCENANMPSEADAKKSDSPSHSSTASESK